MPATSEAQKHLACMALAYKKHGEKAIQDVEQKAAVKQMARDMDEETLRDFCEQPVRAE